MGRQTNKSRRADSAATARQRAAAARAEQKRKDQRRRATTILSSVVAVAVVVALIAYLGITHSGSGKQSATGGRATASAAVVSGVKSVSAATLASVGVGSATSAPKKNAAGTAALTADGKPKLLYVGAEFCPLCAANRWAMAVALSKFGTFAGLKTVSSSSTDSDPNTPTLSFYGSTYTSQYLTFTAYENETRTNTALQAVSAADTVTWKKYTSQSYPFLDFGGKFVVTSNSYDPAVLAGKTQAQIASVLNTPGNTIAKAVDGTANTYIAAICAMTGDKPAAVCSSTTTSKIEASLNG